MSGKKHPARPRPGPGDRPGNRPEQEKASNPAAMLAHLFNTVSFESFVDRIRDLMQLQDKTGAPDARASQAALGMFLKAVEVLGDAQKTYQAPAAESNTPPLVELVSSPAARRAIIDALFLDGDAVDAIRTALAEYDLAKEAAAAAAAAAEAPEEGGEWS